jgi:hypothetical protein
MKTELCMYMILKPPQWTIVQGYIYIVMKCISQGYDGSKALNMMGN